MVRVRKCAEVFIAPLALLCLIIATEPARALTVTYDYVLVITSMTGSVEDSPFDLTGDAHLAGTIDIAFSEETGQAAVLDNSFVITWDGGLYDSGESTSTKFSDRIEPDGQEQDIFRVQDRSDHDAWGEFTFDLLRLDVMTPADENGIPGGDYLFDSLGSATKNSFDLRFSNGSDKLTYTGFVAFLEPQDALWQSGQPLLSAVPLPSSVASMLGGVALAGALLGRRRRAPRGTAPRRRVPTTPRGASGSV